MVRLATSLTFAFLCSALACPLYASDPDRDFSGTWFLDAAGSNTKALPGTPEQNLTVVQQDVAVRCSSTTANGAAAQWTYLLDGTETRVRMGDETRSSIAKWEGSALLINTQVLASQDYTVMDRWQLSSDRAVLTITRQVETKSGEVEGVLVYGKAAAVDAEPVDRAAPPVQSSEPALLRQPEQP